MSTYLVLRLPILEVQSNIIPYFDFRLSGPESPIEIILVVHLSFPDLKSAARH